MIQIIRLAGLNTNVFVIVTEIVLFFINIDILLYLISLIERRYKNDRDKI